MGTQLPSPKGAQPHPTFGPYLLLPNGCMDQDATWYGTRPQPRVLCVRWGPSPLNFWPVFIIVIVVIVISLEHCAMHSRYWLLQVQVQVLVFYAFYFLEKKYNRAESVPLCTVAPHSANTSNCELVAY